MFLTDRLLRKGTHALTASLKMLLNTFQASFMSWAARISFQFELAISVFSLLKSARRKSGTSSVLVLALSAVILMSNVIRR